MRLFTIVTLAVFMILPVFCQDGTHTVKRKMEPSTQQHIDNFIRRMKFWGEYYGDLAGCENLGLSYDSEVKGGDLLIEGGDWAVFDRRLCSGVYGVSHEDGSIFPIELKRPQEHDIHCFEPVITSSVDALTLMKRYQWFHALFIDWSHVLRPSPFSIEAWKGFENVDADYAKEKPTLKDDPHLALYWLMHFGFTFDARYHDVKAIITHHKPADRLAAVDDALAFFDHTAPDENVPISNSYAPKEEFTDIFLKRRAYLVHTARSYQYASGHAGFETWWRAITLYPRAERYMIQRMRWLGNNLEKFDAWQAFDAALQQTPHPGQISLLHYVRAIHPHEAMKNRRQHAQRFLQELIDNEQLWKNPNERLFGRAMIWDVRKLILDKALLARSTDLYFAGDTLSKEFEDINALLHGESANADIAAVRDAVNVLRQADKEFDPFSATAQQRQAFYQSVDATLHNANALSPDVLQKVISNIGEKEVQKRALHYLFHHNVADKEAIFIDLYIRLEPSDHEIPKIFADTFPVLFQNTQDPNLSIVKQLLFTPPSHYRNDTVAKYGRESAAMFFLDVMHWPDVFAFFMQVLKDERYNEPTDLKETIFTHLLSREYATKINPTHQMSKEQIEAMLDTISHVLRKRGWLKYRFNHEALRSIYYMDNHHAKEWMLRHYNNTSWLKRFPDVKFRYDTLRYNINDAIAESLKTLMPEETLPEPLKQTKFTFDWISNIMK